MTENEIAREVVDVALCIHKAMGPGLLESAYVAVLAHELRESGLRVETEAAVPVRWKGTELGLGFRADLIVEDKVILELKSLESLAPVHHKQLLTYLKLADKRLGLLINFGSALLKHGIFRVVNDLQE